MLLFFGLAIHCFSTQIMLSQLNVFFSQGETCKFTLTSSQFGICSQEVKHLVTTGSEAEVQHCRKAVNESWLWYALKLIDGWQSPGCCL